MLGLEPSLPIEVDPTLGKGVLEWFEDCFNVHGLIYHVVNLHRQLFFKSFRSVPSSVLCPFHSDIVAQIATCNMLHPKPCGNTMCFQSNIGWDQNRQDFWPISKNIFWREIGRVSAPVFRGPSWSGGCWLPWPCLEENGEATNMGKIWQGQSSKIISVLYRML